MIDVVISLLGIGCGWEIWLVRFPVSARPLHDDISGTPAMIKLRLDLFHKRPTQLISQISNTIYFTYPKTYSIHISNEIPLPMPRYISTPSLNPQIFYLGECLVRNSDIPYQFIPGLTADELDDCDEMLDIIYSNEIPIDLMTMLVQRLNVASPVESEQTSSGEFNIPINGSANQENRSCLDCQPEGWVRIMNMYTKLIVMEAVHQRYGNGIYFRQMDRAWNIYDAAVGSAEIVERYPNNAGMRRMLDRYLRECSISVETLVAHAMIGDRLAAAMALEAIRTGTY